MDNKFMTYMEKIDSYGVDLDYIEETSPFELIGTPNRKPLSHWWSNIDLVVSGKLPVNFQTTKIKS